MGAILKKRLPFGQFEITDLDHDAQRLAQGDDGDDQQQGH
jgi:hypothetical protein